MKKILKLFILLLVPVNLMGQLSPVTSQYVLNPLSINPAYAGNRDALNVALFYRRQWTGITGAPTTMNLAVDAPFLDSKLGLGLIITTDKIGVTKETHILTNYSYKISKVHPHHFPIPLRCNFLNHSILIPATHRTGSYITVMTHRW